MNEKEEIARLWQTVKGLQDTIVKLGDLATKQTKVITELHDIVAILTKNAIKGEAEKSSFAESLVLERAWTCNPNGCGCRACNPNAAWFIVCNICGNKRCPHATNHEHACTNSNEPGQPGSVFR